MHLRTHAGRTMNLDELVQSIVTLLNQGTVLPLARFFDHLNASHRSVLYILLATATAFGFLLGRRGRTGRGSVPRSLGDWRVPKFQNSGEELVTRVLSHFGPPNYHLLNHVTLRMADGTTQVDHVLVSRFGVFIIETKDYNGWIFANAAGATWTHVFHKKKFKFQNPILQNYRHVRAVQELLSFLPPNAVRSLVVFTGHGQFKTEIPDGVLEIDRLAEFLCQQATVVMSQNRLEFCVGRLETARLAISGQTDLEHVRSLERRFAGHERVHQQ